MNEWNLAPIQEFSAFFRIFRALFMRNSRYFIIFWEYPWKSDKIPSKFRRKISKFIDQNQNDFIEMKFHFIPAKKFDGFLLEFWGVSGAKAKKSCRARKMLKNEATLAIVAVDTGENEPLKVGGVSFHYFNRILSTEWLRACIFSDLFSATLQHHVCKMSTEFLWFPWNAVILASCKKCTL